MSNVELTANQSIVRSYGWAPASSANVGVGFDLLGFSVDGWADEVTVSAVEGQSGVHSIQLTGKDANALPTDPRRNTAGIAANAYLEGTGLELSCELSIHKGIPLASGLGGSAASAVAAVIALNALNPNPLSPEDLIPYALAGEAFVSGAAHPDNVAPSLLGGLTICLSGGSLRSLPQPTGISAVLAHPELRVETVAARAALSDQLRLNLHVQQSAQLAGFIIACYTNDLDLLRTHCQDLVVGPQRAHLIQGFESVQAAALAAGAIACSISGAGPSVYALCLDTHAQAVQQSIHEGFHRANVKADVRICPFGGKGAFGQLLPSK